MTAMISKNEDCRILANNTACLRSVVLRKKSYSMAQKGVLRSLLPFTGSFVMPAIFFALDKTAPGKQ